MEKLKKLTTQSNKSAWSVKRLANYVRSFGLSTLISRRVDEFGEAEITSEWEARICAKRIFKHVAKPGAKYVLNIPLSIPFLVISKVMNSIFVTHPLKRHRLDS